MPLIMNPFKKLTTVPELSPAKEAATQKALALKQAAVTAASQQALAFKEAAVTAASNAVQATVALLDKKRISLQAYKQSITNESSKPHFKRFLELGIEGLGTEKHKLITLPRMLRNAHITDQQITSLFEENFFIPYSEANVEFDYWIIYLSLPYEKTTITNFDFLYNRLKSFFETGNSCSAFIKVADVGMKTVSTAYSLATLNPSAALETAGNAYNFLTQVHNAKQYLSSMQDTLLNLDISRITDKCQYLAVILKIVDAKNTAKTEQDLAYKYLAIMPYLYFELYEPNLTFAQTHKLFQEHLETKRENTFKYIINKDRFDCLFNKNKFISKDAELLKLNTNGIQSNFFEYKKITLPLNSSGGKRISKKNKKRRKKTMKKIKMI